MKKQKLTSILVITALALLMLAGCGPKQSRQTTELSWDGSQITGAQYYVRRMGTVTVHYTPPTMPERVELLAAMSDRLLTAYSGWGHLAPGEQVDIWVLPTGTTTVNGFQWLLDNQVARAVKPNLIVAREEAIPNNELDMVTLQFNGLPEALAVAVTQPGSSPVFEVPWLHDGLGNLYINQWVNFPANAYARAPLMFIQRSAKVWTAEEVIYRLNNPSAKITRASNMQGPYPPGYRQAAVALSGLLVDRWGVNWPETYQRSAEQLTPTEALKWAMEETDEQKAMKSFEDRMAETIEEAYRAASGRVQAPPTLALRGLNRVKPEPVAGVGPGQVPMPTYEVNVDWDPATRTLTGAETVTWVNGRSAAVGRLYMTVWGNHEYALPIGGRSTVESVSINGQPVPFSVNQMDLEIPLEKPVEPGSSLTLKVNFKTQLGAIGFVPQRWGQLPTSQPSQTPTADTYQAALFYPTLAILDQDGWKLASFPPGYADPGTHVVRIRVPKGNQVEQPVGRGKDPIPPVSVTKEAGTTLYEFRSAPASNWSGTITVPRPVKK